MSSVVGNARVSGSLQMGLAPAEFSGKELVEGSEGIGRRCKFRLIEVEFPNKTGNFLFAFRPVHLSPIPIGKPSSFDGDPKRKSSQRRSINKFQPFLAVHFFSPYASIIAMHVANFVTHRGRHRMQQPQRAVKIKVAFTTLPALIALAATHILLT